jgi:predicted nucleotidyltransferase
MDANLIQRLRQGFAQTPVQQAWIFGSFARNEETSNSDIDVLVRFVPDAKISLFEYGGMVYDLEQLTGRKVDMVQENMLKSFAQKSVEQDKILIYERKTS